MSVVATDPFAGLAPIDLDELNERAALQTRIDRKYIVGHGQMIELMERLTETVACRILTIDERHRFGYRSTYYDTPALDSYLAAARSRPTRYKVRVRTYLDNADRFFADAVGADTFVPDTFVPDTFVEVKTRRQGGSTVKVRSAAGFAEHTALSTTSLAFVDSALAAGLTRRVANAARARLTQMAPTLVTDYSRVTLFVDDAGCGASRATVDTALRQALPGQLERASHPSAASGTESLAIIETKSTSGASAVDRFLWSHRIRPSTVSKFGIGMAIQHPELPRHKWHRLIQTYSGPPARSAA